MKLVRACTAPSFGSVRCVPCVRKRLLSDTKYLENYTPIARAREVYRLNKNFNPNYSEKKERDRLMTNLRVQKHRLEETLAIIQVFCEHDVEKLSAFETLLKARDKEKDTKKQTPALAIAVVRPSRPVARKPVSAAVAPARQSAAVAPARQSAAVAPEPQEKTSTIQQVCSA